MAELLKLESPHLGANAVRLFHQDMLESPSKKTGYWPILMPEIISAIQVKIYIGTANETF